MSAASEYLPSEAEGQPLNPFKLRPGQFELTLAATKAVLTDPALTAGAKALYSFYLEFSFEPSCGGLAAGAICIPLDLVVSMFGHDRHSIVGWKKALIKRAHIWEQPIASPTRSGWPWKIIYVSCLIPKTTQTELFDLTSTPTWGREVPHGFAKLLLRSGVIQSVDFRTSSGGTNGTSSGGTNGTSSGGTNGTSSGEQTHTLSKGGKDSRRGSGSTPGQSIEKPENNAEDVGFQKWRAKLSKLYPRELKDIQERLLSDLKTLRHEASNFKRGEMRKDVADIIRYWREQLGSLQALTKPTPAHKAQAADYLKKISALEADEQSYARGPYTPAAAAQRANITRKLTALEEALR